jgi:hypothetical protein
MSIVPPSSEGNPPLDDGALNVSGKSKALLLLEQIKNEIAAIEAWVQTVPDKPGTDAPAPPPPPPPPAPPSPTPAPPGHKKHGKKHRRH